MNSNLTSPFDEKQLVDSNMLWREWNWPTYILDFPDSVRCGRGNVDHANVTEVLTVKAGETIEIAHMRSPPIEWKDDMFYECADERGTCDHRPGYMVVSIVRIYQWLVFLTFIGFQSPWSTHSPSFKSP